MASQAYKILIKAKDQASGTFKKVGGAAKGAAGAVGSVAKVALGATVAIAAVATTVAVLAKKSFDFADAIGKVSTRTGMATDTIQGFQIASVLAGSTVDAANTSLEKFTRSVGDAQRGLKTQADIFRDLGVSITDVNGNTKDMDTLFREVTQAMKGLTSQSAKATVAANLFGRAGIKILGAIDGMGLGIDDFIEKAKDYGLILDRDSIKKSELFNDTLYVLTRQFQILKAEIAVAFLPIFQRLTAMFVLSNQKMSDGEEGIKGFAETIRDSVIGGFLAALKATNDFLKGIGATLSGFKRLGLEASNLGTHLQRAGQMFMFVAHSADMNALKAGLALVQYDLLEKQFVDVEAAMAEFNKTNGNTTKSLDDMITSLEKFLDGAFGELDPETKKIVEDLFNLSDAFKVVEGGVTDNLDPMAKLAATFETLEQRQMQWKTIWARTFDQAADALTDFVETGKLEWQDFMRMLLRDIVRLQIRMQMANIFGWIGDTPDTPADTGNNSPFGYQMPKTYTGGGYTGMGARAGGIDGKGGFPAILHPNETVLDHTKGQGGVVINQTVSFATGVQETVRNEVLQLLPDIAETSKGAVLEAMNRGGAFRRGMK